MNLTLMFAVSILFSVGTAFAAVGTDQLTDGAVTTPKIADGAVTEGKIGGTISQSKVNGLEMSLAGKADVTHNHDTLYQQKYGKVAVVAQTGGDYTGPVAAMSALSAWCGSPSPENPCLLKIMPGIYDLAGASLQMQPYVDLEGSGEKTTTIASSTANGAIRGAANTEVRYLTVQAGGGAGIVNQSAGPMSITHVSIASSYIGISNLYTALSLNQVTISGDGGAAYPMGIYAESANVSITNSKIMVSTSADGP